MKRDLYAEVSTRIIAELEAGAAPWIKPWSATAGQNVPQNAVTNRPYSGCNVILLWLARSRGWSTPRFLTFKQALEAGGNVRKGEHGTKVYFVKQFAYSFSPSAFRYSNKSRVRPSNDIGWISWSASNPRIRTLAFLTCGPVLRQEFRYACFEGRQRVRVLVPFLAQVACEIVGK